MRTRTRNVLETIGYKVNISDQAILDSDGSLYSQSASLQSGTYTLHRRNEVISDQIPQRPEVYVDPKTGRWKRFRYPRIANDEPFFSRAFGQNRSFRPVNPCTHTKTVTRPYGVGEFVVVESAHKSGPARLFTRTRTYTDAFAWVRDRALNGSNSAETAFSNATKAYSASNYRKVDWFALMDKFDQATTEFMPSSFLVGEDIYENDVFVDAFKILLNPTNAIKILLRDSEKFFSRKALGRMKLGEFKRSSKALAMKGINADLFYKFGVRPAIRDIQDALAAHDKVSTRMRFLRQNGGSWVPIRVKQELLASISNVPPGPLAPGVTTRLFTTCERKLTTGTISAYGRIRPDLDWNDTWTAYGQYFGLDHVVGLAWELIPFSFCVDWFTNAKSRIDYYTRLRTGGPFCGLRNICASLKTETNLCLFANPGFDASDGLQIKLPSSPVHLADQSVVSYERYNSIPSTSGVVDLSTLGLFHGVTAGELILQKHG